MKLDKASTITWRCAKEKAETVDFHQLKINAVRMHQFKRNKSRDVHGNPR